MVKKIPQQFITADGAEFTDKKTAERHEASLKAIANLAEAQKSVLRAMAGECLTADGVPFSFERDPYYILREGFPSGSHPRLLCVEFWWYCDRVHPADREGRGPFIATKDRGDRETNFVISDLYADRKAAIAAWEAACEKWLTNAKADIERYRKSYAERGPERIY